MHTFEAKNGTLFHHNGDLSGSIICVNSDCERIFLNSEDLQEFAFEVFVKTQIADKLDAALDALKSGQHDEG